MGIRFGSLRLSKASSAHVPTSTLRISFSMSRHFAPSMVAVSKNLCAFAIVGSHLYDLWIRAQIFMVSNMSRLLLLAGPSVPKPTETPDSHISGNGATPPPATFILDPGQCATLTPRFPRRVTSLLVSQTE